MPLPLIALAVVAVAAVADGVYDDYSASYDEAEGRGKLGEAANNEVSGDRTIIQSERARLESGFDGTYSTPVLTGKLDDFSTLSHQQIWDALNGSGDQPGVSAGEINAGADGWRRLVTGMSDAVTNFRTRIDTPINEGWSGTTANAAIDGVRGYATEAEKLPTTFQMVANGIDLMEGALLQAKMAIDKPKELSLDGQLTAWIPDGGVLKDEQYRIDEAERAAQEILERVYKPQAVTADEKTPVLAVPKNPIGDGGLPVDTGNGGGSNNGGGNGSTGNGDQGTPQTTPQTATPQTTNPTTDTPDDDTDDNADDDSSGDDTSPAAATPSTDPTNPAATQQNPTGTPNTGAPGTGTPGSGGSPGTGSPGLGATAQSPGAGRAVPGSPSAGTPTAAAAGRAATAGARGMSGMPGMMGGGAGRGGGSDDENEHKTPDYLIQDREHELIGQLPPTLPPGGVIGA